MSSNTNNPRRIRVPNDPDYAGRQDYQGNHDVFEMPEDQKPSGRSWPKLPVNKIALAVIVIGIVILLGLVCTSIFQQSSLVQ